MYSQVLYKGEILKKIEYKFKDWTGYFYLRQLLTIKSKKVKLNNMDINLNNLNKDNFKQTYNYKIFNKNIKYDDIITKINCNKEFWRKTKISEYDDIKILWEYNRLQFLLPISINFLKTRDSKYKKLIRDILEAWDSNNQFEYSLNWNSNLEVSIRAINISLVLLLLNDSDLNNEYSNLLYLHAKHIYNEINFSDKCIPNNHVIGEATALLMLSRIIDVKENKKWYKKSIKILKKHWDIIDNDGVSKENSFSYQFFVTKMYILSLCFIDNQDYFNKISNKINKSLEVLSYCYIDENTYLNYGDNDDGFLYSTNNDYNLVKDIIQYYKLFSSNYRTDETSLYMSIFNKFNPNKKIINLNPSTNNYIYNKEIFIYKNKKDLIFFNAKNINGHSHNDSLAINLIINGEEIFIDSGTYSYNINKKIRNYYRSREAHSTILFKEKNAIPVSTFRWKNCINCFIDNVEENEEYIQVTGILDNVCSRSIKIYKSNNKIEIIDYSYNLNKMISNFILSKNASFKDKKINIKNINVQFGKNINSIEDAEISKSYLVKQSTKKCKVCWIKTLKTIIDKNNGGD